MPEKDAFSKFFVLLCLLLAAAGRSARTQETSTVADVSKSASSVAFTTATGAGKTTAGTTAAGTTAAGTTAAGTTAAGTTAAGTTAAGTTAGGTTAAGTTAAGTTAAGTTAAGITAAGTMAAGTTAAGTTAAGTTAAGTTAAGTTVAGTTAAGTTAAGTTLPNRGTTTFIASTPEPTTATSNESYIISLAIIWLGEDMSKEATRQFYSFIVPSIRQICPSSNRINRTAFNLIVVQLDQLLNLDDVQVLQRDLTDGNFLFTGLRSSPLTPLLETVVSYTTVPGFTTMKYHTIAPMSLELLQSALIKVIDQRNRESLYPSSPANYRAAMFIDDSIEITQMTALFQYFRNGLMFFRYTDATVQASLVQIKSNRIINIIVLLPAAAADRLKLQAFGLSMFNYHYRWYIHGSRLINADFDSRMTTYSTNVTSLEFGRVQDTLLLDLRTTSAVLVYDLEAIWQIYLKQYLCNEATPVNRTYPGLSGSFRLYPNGAVTRTNWRLQIYRGLEARKEQIGEWSSDGSFTMLSRPDPSRTAETSLNELRLNQFRMVTVIIPPYVMYKEGVSADAPLSARLTGMYIELCKEILAALKITNYDFFLQEDQAFGVFNKTWNGMIKTMMDGRAQLACAPVTIETSRKEVVDFTKVVHTSQQSILYRQAAADAFAEMFQFLQPLDTMIWLTVLGVLVYVAIVLAIMHRIIPNKGIKLKLYDSLFFSFSEVVQGTSGAVPNQISGRIVVAFFWFFTLFLLLTYIANYAAFRLLDGVQQKVESLQTLLQNSAFEFGIIENTITETLLQKSSFVYMQQMYGLIADTFANGFVSNETVAVQIMQNESLRYALIGDSLQNQYLMETNCNLINTGQFYALKSALVLPPGNEYGTYFDDQIVRLGPRITELQRQFFNVANKKDCTDRSFLGYVKLYTPPNPGVVKEGALTLTNTLGIAMINLFGCIFALLLSAVERSFSRFLQKRSEARRRTQVSEAYAMAQRSTMLE